MIWFQGCHFEESTHMFSSYYDSGICLNNVKCLPVSIIVHDGNRVNRHEPSMEPVVEKTTTSCQMQTNNLSVYRTSETLVVSSASSSSSSFTRHTCTSDVVSSTVEYSVGSDDSESNGDTVAVSFLSAPETSMPVKKPYRESRGKMRFKKFFEPLRRSHSAGNPKDSPKMFYSSKYPTHKQDEVRRILLISRYFNLFNTTKEKKNLFNSHIKLSCEVCHKFDESSIVIQIHLPMSSCNVLFVLWYYYVKGLTNLQQCWNY